MKFNKGDTVLDTFGEQAKVLKVLAEGRILKVQYDRSSWRNKYSNNLKAVREISSGLFMKVS